MSPAPFSLSVTPVLVRALRDFGCSKTVTATASSTEKLKFITSMPNGATHGVNYRNEDFAVETKKVPSPPSPPSTLYPLADPTNIARRQFTEDAGIDIIIDFVGKSHWAKNIDCMAKDGRMIILATLSGASFLPLCVVCALK